MREGSYLLKQVSAVCLANLSFNETNQDRFRDEGSIPVIVETLRESIQISISFNISTEKTPNHNPKATNDQEFLSSNEQGDSQSTLLVNLCRSLANLAFDNEENEVQIIQLDGIESLLTLLDHEDDAVRLESTAVLANLARNPIARTKIMLNSGLPRLLTLLRSGIAGVEKQSLRCVTNLLLSEEAQSDFLNGGGLPLLFFKAAMSTDAELQELLARAIMNLSVSCCCYMLVYTSSILFSHLH